MDLTQIFNQIDAVAAVAIVAMVVAVIELLKRLFQKDWAAATYIVAAGVVGVLGGMLLGTNLVYAGILGLAASGVYKLAQTASSTQQNNVIATQDTAKPAKTAKK